MSIEQEKQIITGWSQNSIMIMSKLGVSPTPENYNIFYEYVRGGNKQLMAEVQKIINEKTTFTRETTERLYSKYVSNEIDKKMVEENTVRIEQIMHNVLNAIDNSSNTTSEYNSELNLFTSELESADKNQLQSVIGKIITRTKEIQSKGQILQKQLEQAHAEVDTLKSNLEEASEQIKKDALTGVSNRKAFDEVITALTEESKSTNRPLCLLMVDVDYFKRFNDTYGHLLGDQVLKIVAASMKDMVKGKDFVARYGGEEFAVLLPDTPIKGAQIVAESIRSTIATRELKRKDTGESYGQITVSVGGAIFHPVMDKIEDFIERADKALYKSKKNGRNRVTIDEQS